MIDKGCPDRAAAVAALTSGASVAIGGFATAGVPEHLVAAVCERGLTGLHVISNAGGMGTDGIGRLFTEGRVRRFTTSFPVHPALFDAYDAGELELELVPQGTLAERLRAGGAGMGAFYTPTAAHTLLGDGGFTTRHGPDGRAATQQPPREQRRISGRDHVLEYPLRPDFALVRAERGDRYGNLRFRLAARNFNPLCAMAAAHTVAEVAHLEAGGTLDPDDAHLPGVFVHALVAAAPPARTAGAGGVAR